jgi:hypothetical protein
MINKICILFCSVILFSSCKKEKVEPALSNSTTTNTVAPTTTNTNSSATDSYTDSSTIKATINGSTPFDSYPNYGVIRIKGGTTDFHLQGRTDSSMQSKKPLMNFSFNKNHFKGGTFQINKGYYIKNNVQIDDTLAVTASYRLDGVFYKAISGTINITKIDSAQSGSMYYIANLKAFFSFNTDTDTTTKKSFTITDGVIDVYPLSTMK